MKIVYICNRMGIDAFFCTCTTCEIRKIFYVSKVIIEIIISRDLIGAEAAEERIDLKYVHEMPSGYIYHWKLWQKSVSIAVKIIDSVEQLLDFQSEIDLSWLNTIILNKYWSSNYVNEVQIDDAAVH